MSTIRVVNLQHTDATEPNIVLQSDGTSVFASGITISGGTNLTVSGTAEFASGTVSAPGITFIDDNNTGIYEPAADTVAITTGATERLRIDSNGRLLLGTTTEGNPYADELTIANSGDSGLTIRSGTVNQGNILFSDGTSGADEYRGQIMYDHNTNVFGFITDAIERLRIDSNGRLLLGTTTEGYATLADKLTIANAGHCGMTIRSGSSHNGSIYFSDATSGGDEYDGYIEYQHTGRNLLIGTAQGTRLTIDSAGNVGIGTTSPAAPLHVKSTAVNQLIVERDGSGTQIGAIIIKDGSGDQNRISSTDSNLVFGYGAGNTEAMRIDNAGRVGINMTSFADSATALAIKNGSASNEHTWLDMVCDTNETLRLRFSEDGSTFPGQIKYETLGDNLVFTVNSSERMRIDSSGHVAIGSSTTFTHFSVVDGNVGLELDPDFGFSSRADTGTLRTYDRGNSAYRALGLTGSEILFGISDVEKVRIDTSGNLLVGNSTSTSLSDRLLQIGSVSRSSTYAELRTSTSGTAGIVWSDGTSGDSGYRGTIEYSHTTENMTFKTSAEPRMRLDTSGMLRVRGTSADGALNVFTGQSASNSINLILGQHSSTSVTSGTLSFLVLSNGDVKNSNNTYGSISDINLKENIVDANSQWDDIKSLRVRNYNFKEETGHETFTQIGVIAQEIETVSPGLVSSQPNKDEEGNDLDTVTKAVKYSVLYMKAVKALQEAMERIESLETRIATLENN